MPKALLHVISGHLHCHIRIVNLFLQVGDNCVSFSYLIKLSVTHNSCKISWIVGVLHCVSLLCVAFEL